MDIGAIVLGGNGYLRQMGPRANQQLGQMDTLEQMSILGPMDIGASGL